MSNEATADSLSGTLKPTKHGRILFQGLALTLLVLVLLGFGPTFFLRPFLEVAAIPLYVHLHGLALTSWYVLFLVQSSLVVSGRVGIHRKIGIVGLFVGLAVVATSIVVVMEIVDRVFVAFDGDVATASEVMWGSFVRIFGFTIFLGVALAQRRNREIHRRSVAIASIAIIQPAIGRITFDLLGLDITSALFVMYSLILASFAVLILFDLQTKGRPHVISIIGLLYFSAGAILERTFGRTEVAQQIIGL